MAATHATSRRMDTGRVTALGQGRRIERIFQYLYRRFVRPTVAMTSHLFESLDYLYVPAPDVEAAERFYTVTIGGELRWRRRSNISIHRRRACASWSLRRRAEPRV